MSIGWISGRSLGIGGESGWLFRTKFYRSGSSGSSRTTHLCTTCGSSVCTPYTSSPHHPYTHPNTPNISPPSPHLNSPSSLAYIHQRTRYRSSPHSDLQFCPSCGTCRHSRWRRRDSTIGWRKRETGWYGRWCRCRRVKVTGRWAGWLLWCPVSAIWCQILVSKVNHFAAFQTWRMRLPGQCSLVPFSLLCRYPSHSSRLVSTIDHRLPTSSQIKYYYLCFAHCREKIGRKRTPLLRAK